MMTGTALDPDAGTLTVVSVLPISNALEDR